MIRDIFIVQKFYRHSAITDSTFDEEARLRNPHLSRVGKSSMKESRSKENNSHETGMASRMQVSPIVTR